MRGRNDVKRRRQCEIMRQLGTYHGHDGAYHPTTNVTETGNANAWKKNCRTYTSESYSKPSRMQVSRPVNLTPACRNRKL